MSAKKPPPAIIGERFSRLTVVAYVGRRGKGGFHYFSCRCDCGEPHEVSAHNLSKGAVKSCGCLPREINTTHGAAGSPEYVAWQNILSRCTNPNMPNWKDYGGRGIGVHPRWLESFEAFLSDVGPRPSPRHTIDRYPNNDGDYEPGNVRWATWAQQCRNQRKTIRLTFRGETLALADWAERVGLPARLIDSRIRAGWSAERALTEPSQRSA